MRKTILISMLLFIICGYSQVTKKELIDEIENYKMSKLLNSTYNFSFKEVFDALSIMGNQYYGNTIKESESRGYLEYLKETDDIKEYLSIEIKGDKQPYKLSFSYRKERKKTSFKTEGEFGKPNYKIIPVDAGWSNVEVPVNIIYTNLHLRIYKILNGDFILSEELLKKIKDFNSNQKRDRKKVLAGTDYEI